MIDTFKCGEKVKFHSTSDALLDSMTGEIVGKSFDSPCGSHYIVLMDGTYENYPTDGPPWKAICITEHCLTQI